jgi:uncharacterized protein (TIGR03435 family)
MNQSSNQRHPGSLFDLLYADRMILHRSHFLLLSTAIALAPQGLSQSNANHLTYEIVSIRPSDPNSQGGGIDPLPKGIGYNAIGVTIRDMLSVMYRIPKRQITGGPTWIHNERFDVLVRADRPYSIDDLHAMFVNALADRFDLKLHVDTKLGPIYALRVAKSGLKMTQVDEGTDRNSPIHSEGDNQFTGDRVPLNYLCFWLGMKLQQDNRPVMDKTGLTGHYNFKLSFRPQLSTDARETSDLPSIFDAVKDQLGLQLLPQEGPVRTIVIDHIERPTPN